MKDVVSGNGNPTASSTWSAIDVPTTKPDPALHAVLRPFLDQSVSLISVVAIAWNRSGGETGKEERSAAPTAPDNQPIWIRLAGGGNTDPTPIRLPSPTLEGNDAGHGTFTLNSLARRARELSKDDSGDHLLLLPAQALEPMIAELPLDPGFRAVAIVSSPGSDPAADENAWQLQRVLFDCGLVNIGTVRIPNGEVRCFLASDAVRSFRRLGTEGRGRVSISSLGSNGRFANQLFQYVFAKLYALRHALTAAVPPWQGQQLFDLPDPSCDGLGLPELRFIPFNEKDRLVWDSADPPINVDLWGYFQEIPECWRRHRALLRHMFQVCAEHQHAIDAWHDDVTRGGRRTLVAVHVRRDDYRVQVEAGKPWFRLVPVQWYVAWLRTIWPTLSDPILFVATDEPGTVLPFFLGFEVASATCRATAPALPDHVRDFEVLRRADYLAICNSSFSRMAAILAPSTQKCVIPSFSSQTFEPYQPWIDPGFWARFAADSPAEAMDLEPLPIVHERSGLFETTGHFSLDRLAKTTTVYFNVSDLLLYLRHHATLSGIQRVQCEIMRCLIEASSPESVRLVALDSVGDLSVVDRSALRDLVEEIRSRVLPKADLDSKLTAIWDRAVPLFVQAQEVFLTIGAFWGVSGTGLLFQELKNRGVTIGVFIHDIIPVTDPEYFNAPDIRIFVKGLVEAMTFADFILTTSEYNKASLVAHMAARDLRTLPVRVTRLAHELPIPVPSYAIVSDLVAGITKTRYVLCVGTIEVRKNPTYLFNIWRLMIRAGREDIPTLVFVGRKGWLVRDFMEQLKTCNYLDGRIVVLHHVTDSELALLYRRCLLTVFPSLAEGWGLPVGESLAYGKITLASRASGIPEVGGDLVDYIDPYNASEGLERLLTYLDNPELRHKREREIAGRFNPRLWRTVADDVLNSTRALARQARPFKGVAAMTLPPNRYLPISSDAGAIYLDGIDGELSADLICISGWRRPGRWGVWAGEPTTVLRFRAQAAVGDRINLVMRMVVPGGCRDIRISSGSGTETTVSVASGADRTAVLPCEVETDNLVTIRMGLARSVPGEDDNVREPYWGLKGILYFQTGPFGSRAPKRSADDDPIPEDPPLTTPGSEEEAVQPDRTSSQEPVLLVPSAPLDASCRAASFDAFGQSADSYWPSEWTTHRDAPIFADDADKEAFYKFQGCNVGAVTERLTLIRRSDQYVSMTRYSEGSVFDRMGVSKGWGYLQTSPPVEWLSRQADEIWTHQASLEAARSHDKRYVVFYNGNLQNYYHWMVEGILSLDILSHAMGPDANLNIVLPKSMDIDARFDHRGSLRAVGLDVYPVEEVSADFIKVKEAIWLESDLVESMPPVFLKRFQERMAARYAGFTGRRHRRLLVERRRNIRTIHNIEQVQSYLSRYDFETVYLEGMSIVDQILLFQSAEFVIGTHGAGLSNLLFCEPGTRVIEFMPSAEMRPFFWLISDKLNLPYGVQFCAAAGGQGFRADIHVDVCKLQALYGMMDAHGSGA